MKISKTTRNNWMIDAVLFTSGIIAALTAIYFLFFPIGGFQGGRNPMYGITFLFERTTWDDFHTWSGIILVAIAAVHLTIHWNWVVNMARRSWNELRQWRSSFNRRGRYNLVLNLVIALSFILTAASSMYFLFYSGGRSGATPTLLFSYSTWDLIHTWSGTVWIVAAVLHFAIHWGWVVKVTRTVVGDSGSLMQKLQPHRPGKVVLEK